MSKIRVGVLRGGPSDEYNVSLKTGGNVLRNLPDSYIGQDILITKDGTWHVNGIPHTPEQALKKVDVIFNGLHGAYGEDGKVQKILEAYSMPFTGSKSYSSLLSMNKLLSRDYFKQGGIKTPYSIAIEPEEGDKIEDIALKIFRSFPMPAIVKPISSGSSVGVSVASDFKSLKDSISLALQYGNQIIIEEFIRGREATCGIIEKFRGQQDYGLLPVELKNRSLSHFKTKDKIEGNYEFQVPGNFSEDEKLKISEIAKDAHKILDLRHYSTSDFIISPKRGIYLLEVNSLPGLHEHSLLPKSLEASGATMSEFLDHVISLALEE